MFHKQLVQGSKQPIGATFPIKPSSVDKWDTDYRGGQGKLERDNKISFIQLYNEAKQCLKRSIMLSGLDQM